MADEEPVDFICNHTRGYDDQPPEHIPMFLYGRGNASRATRDLDNEAEADVHRAMYDPDDAYKFILETGATPEAMAERLRHAQGHHEIRCPTCRFTERLGGEDIETLRAFAARQGWPSVPLTIARQILQEIAATRPPSP